MIPWVGLALLLLLMPLVVARFVLRDREGFRGWWFFLMAVILLLPAIGIVFAETFDDWFEELDLSDWMSFWGVMAVVVGPIGLAGKWGDGARRQATVRLMGWCFFASAVGLGVMAKGFYWEEKYWVARNVLWEPSAEYPTKAWGMVTRGQRLEHSEFVETLRRVRVER